MRRHLRVLAAGLGSVVLAGPTSADIWLDGHRDAPKTTCAGRIAVADTTCAFPAIGGQTFVVSGFGAVAFVVTLEVPGDVAGAPPTVLARCDGIGADGCIGGATHTDMVVAEGTPLTCRAWGIGQGSFECATFKVYE